MNHPDRITVCTEPRGCAARIGMFLVLCVLLAVLR
jgi:hypothetical protein